MKPEIAQPSRPAVALATLIEQTARGIYDQRGPAHIHPVQWAALRFFARANRRARSVAGLARYLDVTLAPASRTVSALKRHGLISTEKDPEDARVSVISLTPAGRELLQSDPIFRLARALQDLPDEQFETLGQSLADITARMSNGMTGEAASGRAVNGGRQQD
ncbi:MAG: MarR family winged helix-turn-helix transcriptional regulator [Minwuia sp.]|uniref:MarR family winged helix-turn-helix transcriptional regulator n=1 Tax=Minwuia sp. TaxID=2493630 RepID=UPI003A8A7980